MSFEVSVGSRGVFSMSSRVELDTMNIKEKCNLACSDIVLNEENMRLFRRVLVLSDVQT